MIKYFPDVAKRIAQKKGEEGNPGTAPDKRLLKVAIEREPLKVARELGYEVHWLSPTDIVDKADYASGYRFRLSKAVLNQPYPQIVMARSEGEVVTFLKRQTEGGSSGNPMPEEVTKQYTGEEGIPIKVVPIPSRANPGKWALYDKTDGTIFGIARDTYEESVQAANKENRRLAPLEASPPPIRKSKKLLSAEQISDFRVGIDKMVREGDKTFVIDTEGVRKKVEVQSDAVAPEFVENIRKLNPEQKAKMIEQVETTPYLSDEGRAERLVILQAKREGNPTMLPSIVAAQTVFRKEEERKRKEKSSNPGGNPMTEKKRHYSQPYLSNWQYGGYSYVEEDPTKPEALWPHGMADFVNPVEVIAIAEKAGIAQISLAGGFWERIGYKGWGEKVSISEARTALAKAKQLFAPETIDLTKGRMVEIPLGQIIARIPPQLHEGCLDKLSNWVEPIKAICKIPIDSLPTEKATVKGEELSRLTAASITTLKEAVANAKKIVGIELKGAEGQQLLADLNGVLEDGEKANWAIGSKPGQLRVDDTVHDLQMSVVEDLAEFIVACELEKRGIEVK